MSVLRWEFQVSASPRPTYPPPGLKRFFILGAAAILAAAVGVAACSSGSGGATSCGDFRAMSSGDQLKTVQNMISLRHADSSPANVDLTLGSVRAYCFLHKPGDRIDGIYSG